MAEKTKKIKKTKAPKIEKNIRAQNFLRFLKKHILLKSLKAK